MDSLDAVQSPRTDAAVAMSTGRGLHVPERCGPPPLPRIGPALGAAFRCSPLQSCDRTAILNSAAAFYTYSWQAGETLLLTPTATSRRPPSDRATPDPRLGPRPPGPPRGPSRSRRRRRERPRGEDVPRVRDCGDRISRAQRRKVSHFREAPGRWPGGGGRTRKGRRSAVRCCKRGWARERGGGVYDSRAWSRVSAGKQPASACLR